MVRRFVWWIAFCVFACGGQHANIPDGSTGGGVCGDGNVEGGEQCDDENTVSADGCSAICLVEDGWVCPTPGQPCLPRCGDGAVKGSERCDLGPNNGQNTGCTASCMLQPGFVCPGNVCHATVCGDGVKEGDEQCDLGAMNSPTANRPDQCTTACTIPPHCGDGIIESQFGEHCDDGNSTSGDGCTASCEEEPGYTCLFPGVPCVKIKFCGDGIIQPPETCDDGNGIPGDGCSSACQVEPFFICPAPGQPCVSTIVCGDGKIGPGEQCDDGNASSGDGCSASCRLEPGWVCPTPGQPCIPQVP